MWARTLYFLRLAKIECAHVPIRPHDRTMSEKTLAERKKEVFEHMEKHYGLNPTMRRTFEYLWKILDHEREYPNLLSYYWSHLERIDPSALTTERLNEELREFFEMNPNNIEKYYVADLQHRISMESPIHVAGNAVSVRQFTEESRGEQPDRPHDFLVRARAEFIVSMVCSEMVELLQTVISPDEDPITVIKSLCGRDYNKNYVKPTDTIEIIAQQADAFVDAMYYMYDTATRMGVNLDRVFALVHKANMDKRGPDGTFVIRPDDKKILKPKGWQEPNIRGEIQRQMQDGAWSP
jgi:predicted HAD superfamily Cof-like phosphohydrolase